MKKLILFLLLASPCFGQVPYPIQSSAFTDTGACVFASDVTAGSTLIFVMAWETSTAATSITDTQSISFTQIEFDTTKTVRSVAYIGTAASTGAETITVTETGAVRPSGSCSEWNFGGMSQTLDGSPVVYFPGSATSISTSITTAVNGDLILSFTKYGGNGINVTTTDTFLAYAATYGHGSAFKIAGLAGSYTTTYTYNGDTHSGLLVLLAFAPAAIQITSPTALPDAIQGDAYSYTLGAHGGAGAYTWSITAGALPLGLSLNTSTGAITGTPTNSNPNTITFQVTDGTVTTTKGCTLHVGSSANTITHVKDSNANTGVFTGGVTAGNLLVAVRGFFADGGNAILKCTDSLGTPFKLSGIMAAQNGMNVLEIFSGIAPSTGADTVTCNGGTSQSSSEFSNVQNFTDIQAYTVGAGSPYTTNSLSTVATNSLLFSGATSTATSGTVVPSAPCNPTNSNTWAGTCYQIATSITGYTVTYTDIASPAHSYMFLEAFRPTSTGTAPGIGTSNSQPSQIY